MSTADIRWEELVSQMDRKIDEQKQVIDDLHKLVYEITQKHRNAIELMNRKVGELEQLICEMLEDEGE